VALTTRAWISRGPAMTSLPRLREYTEEVLKKILGMSKEEIEGLREKKVI